MLRKVNSLCVVTITRTRKWLTTSNIYMQYERSMFYIIEQHGHLIANCMYMYCTVCIRSVSTNQSIQSILCTNAIKIAFGFKNKVDWKLTATGDKSIYIIYKPSL